MRTPSTHISRTVTAVAADVVDDAPGAVEGVEHAVARGGIEQRSAGVRLPLEQAQAPEQQRRPDRPGPPEVLERGVGEQDGGHGCWRRSSAAPGAAERVGDVVEAGAAPVVTGRAADREREVAQIVAEPFELGEVLDAHDRGHRACRGG